MSAGGAASAAGGRDSGGIPSNGSRSPAGGANGQLSPSPSSGSLPSISLPKGGGAIRGIDEKFAVSQATGTASLGVGVFTSPARQGFQPKLALTYDSAAGNGPFGLGWGLAIPSITRKTSKGLPRYDDATDSDVLILSGAEDLIPLLAEASGKWEPVISTRTVGSSSYIVRGYRPRVEGAFARIERWEETVSGDVHWRTISKDNVTSLYGQDATSRIADPEDPSRVFSWLLDLSFDDRGNAVSYVYKAEDASGAPNGASETNRVVGANRYLKRVLYGNEVPYLPGGEKTEKLPAQWCFELVLDYGEHDLSTPTPLEASAWTCRADPFSSYRAGFEVRTYRRCRRLLMFHQLPELGSEAVLVRSTDLTYETSSPPGEDTLPSYTMLASVTQTGWVMKPGGGYQTAQLPSLQLGYSSLTIDDAQHIADASSVQNLTGAIDGTRERWIDLEGEGLQGILSENEGAWYYKRNVSTWNPTGAPASARFEPLTLLGAKPAPDTRDGSSLTLTDLNGDGNLCAVSFAPPSPGWFEYDADSGWAPFQEFQATANVDWASPNLRFVDLDGDGLADVLITEDDALSWHEWLPERGFASADRVAKPFDEERGPVVAFAEPTGSILLADMSGDGLADLVRIREGEVCYWPNLGYGRFGAKVAMDNAPAFDFCDRFDARRVRLADIDGSGTADILYLGEQATVWFNQSGNSWTAGRELGQFPPFDSCVQASVFDLLGTGTACLVWTSALPGDVLEPLRYIDLTGGVKPYLLTNATNNLGARRTLSYAPSTKFYLQDRAAGKPWLTRLPFPVHVVERVETDDDVSRTSSVSQYSYHHGFYDGVEREFRGFARVEVLDSDTLPAQSGVGVFTSTPQMSDETFLLAPTWTRTWYHTGAFFEREDIAARLAEEYYAGDPHAPKLETTLLPLDASAEELREACRALRGQVLREEIYAQDGMPAAVNPYVTREHRYEVDRLQPGIATSYGGFYAWEREHVECHYERDPNDPRVTHQLSLAIDFYGNLTRQASVAYPRRTPAYPEQSATWVRYSESDVINVAEEPDWYRLGLPVETRAYELTGVDPDAASGLYDPVSLGPAAAAATEIPYEATPDGTTAQRRLLDRNRTIYRSDDLSTALPIGQVQSLALIDTSYAMRYTSGLLAATFGAKLSPGELTALLSGPGAFVDLDENGNQWAPSPRAFYSAEPAHPDASYARAHFYLPQGTVDQWGNVTTVIYDDHNLLVLQHTDALGNTTLAQGNYRVLEPWLLTDPNLNRSGVRYDPLGLILAAALMGKPKADGTNEGDYLDTSTPEPSPNDDPTTRLEYDLGAYATWASDPSRDPDRPEPAWVCTQARVRHKDPTTPWLASYAYSDGLGRIALSKTQAEPGEAPERSSTGSLIRDGKGALVFGPCDNRWVGSGRVVHDNKGNPVKAYEPFFDSSPLYDDESDLVEWGVTAITRYDPLSRPIRVDNPNGTLRMVEFDPWHTVSSDENDTVLESEWYTARSGGALGVDEADAVSKAAACAETPASTDLDSLGRMFRSVADNGAGGQYATVLQLDIDGYPLSTTDALGRAVLTQDYDMAGAEIHRVSVDAGERWLLADATGQPLRAWDSRGAVIGSEYDALRRPTDMHVTVGGTERLVEQIVYGETLVNAQELNLRAMSYQRRDGAGLATTELCDFKGNILSLSRRLLAEYREQVDWAHAPALEEETFTTTTAYDALNRPVSATTPDGSVSEPTYNQRSLLAAMTVRLRGAGPVTSYVSAVDYDAKAQRQRIEYGNGASTSYTYDPLTFRLTRLRSERSGESATLQELEYTHDPVGNVTRLNDVAQQTIFFDNQVVIPNADYTYDAIYRLITASGREHIGQTATEPIGWRDAARAAIPLPTDGQAMRNYTQTYSYDAVGNIETLKHSASGGGGFTRAYAYDEPTTPSRNNQLTSTTVAGAREAYAYDANGNIDSMPHLSMMRWDWKDQLEATANQIVNEGTPQTTYYRYDGNGERVRKLTDSQNGTRTSQRAYLGPYEVYREYSSTGEVTLERQTLHVSDDVDAICLLETTTVDSGAAAGGGALPTTLTRYQLANMLGSAVLELDENAAIISYEEYYPYGSTSLQSGRSVAEVSLKRYRYTGKERDSENGFSYHGARYYAPWLGRWISCDPEGPKAGINFYAYVSGNPTRLVDPSGRSGWDRLWGAVKAVGGALEVVAGASLIAAGAATSEFGVGFLLMGAGTLVAAHGIDTVQAGVRTVASGENTDTFTSLGLQWAGLSRRAANLVDALIGVIGTLGASAVTKAPSVVGAARVGSEADTLVHLSSAEGANAIKTSQTLGTGTKTVYAGPASLADASTTGRVVRTGLSPANATTAVTIPNSAAGAFRVPAVVGPFTAWQRVFGTVYTTGAGSIDLTSGVFARSGVAWNQLSWYGIDALLNMASRSIAASSSQSNEPPATSANQTSTTDDAPTANLSDISNNVTGTFRLEPPLSLRIGGITTSVGDPNRPSSDTAFPVGRDELSTPRSPNGLGLIISW